MKKLVAIVAAIVASLSLAATAHATNETVVGTTNITSLSGPLYQSLAKPVNVEIRAEVTTPADQPKVNPLKNTKLTFPQGMTFNPDPKMPVCTDAKLNENSVLSVPANVVAACKDSVVGTGTSAIILAKINPAINPATLLSDPILIVFNAGKDNAGRPKIKIYGFSKGTGVGILMEGALVNQVLNIAVPVLTGDAAVKYYQIDLPGNRLKRDDINIDVQGLDKNYVRSTCPASGTWTTKSTFTLGERDFATKQPIPNTEAIVASPDTTQDCTGLAGKAKLRLSVKGPKAVKSGAKGAFKVTVKNTGTGIAKAVKVTATGGGKATAGNINPGASKTVTVKTKVAGKKGSKKTLTFKATGGGSAKVKVTVK